MRATQVAADRVFLDLGGHVVLGPYAESHAGRLDDLHSLTGRDPAVHRGCRPLLTANSHDPIGVEVGDCHALSAQDAGCMTARVVLAQA
jgi:hypothetical protein